MLKTHTEHRGVVVGILHSNLKLMVAAVIAVCVLALLFSASLEQQQQPPAQQQTAPIAQSVDAAGEPQSFLEELRRSYIAAVRDSILGIHLLTPSLGPNIHQDTSELHQRPFQADNRAKGLDWPLFGLSMIGTMRMNSLWELIEKALAADVPGSIVECGVWRGGAALFGKAVLRAHGAQRQVHLFDSFKGLPPNTTQEDERHWSKMSFLAVSKDEVRSGFERYNLTDDVYFHEGYFRYSLPSWREQDMGPIAVLRLDGDMYESTMDQLYNLWEFVSPGGFVIVDDWNIAVSRKAVEEFFQRNNLDPDIHEIDGTGIWVQKAEAAPVTMSWYTDFNESRSADDAV